MSARAGAGSTLDRPLSPVERWYWLADSLSPLNTVGRVRLHGPMSEPALRGALDALQDRHPLLRVAVATDRRGRNPRFVSRAVDRIALRRVDLSADPDEAHSQWQREINEHELVHRLDLARGRVARAVVITREGASAHEVMLTLSHLVADGRTAQKLLTEWLEIAASLMGDARSTGVLASRPALPATEALFPRRHRGPSAAAAVVAHQVRDGLTILRRRPWRIPATEAVPFEQRRTRFVHRTMSRDALDELVRRCRHEGATMHGALVAALATAVARDAAPARPSTIAIGSPMDFTSELGTPVSDDDLGVFVATVATFVQLDSFWAMARAASAEIAARRRRGEPFSMANLARVVCPRSAARAPAFFRLVDAQGPLNVCLSNGGRLDATPRVIGPWRISDQGGAGSISVTGSFLTIAATNHDHFFWNFMYVEGIVPIARAERLADDAMQALSSGLQAQPRTDRARSGVGAGAA